MTELEMLETDLEIHLQSREAIKDGTGGYFIRREGYSVIPILHSYDRIIQSLEEEISSLKKQRRAKKTKSR
jgi:hypothetical protein